MRVSRRLHASLLLMGFLFVLWGCAGPEVKRPRRPITPQVEAPPPPGLEELLVTQVEENRKLEERLLSFSVKGVDIKDVLLSLSKASEINIVFDPGIAGTVTVDLKDVTLAQALEIILTPLELEFRRERNVIRVRKPQLETRVFTIDYVNVKRTGSSSVSTTVSTTGAGLSGGTATVTTTQDSDIFVDLDAGVKALLSAQGKAVVNKASGTVVVTDFPINLRRVAEFLEKFTGVITRQVVINAQVLEVKLIDSFKFGIDWTGVGQILGLKGAFPGAIATTPSLINAPVKQRLSPNSGIFQISVTDNDFQAIIDAVSTQGDVNVLSNPKVAAMNNQKAVIRVAQEEVFFRTTVRTLQQTGLPTTERVTEVTPQTVAVGIVLDVTPQISSDGTVAMHIHPIVTEKVGAAVAPTGETAPILSIRETDTMVKVRDGQTIIIGGLMKEKQDDTVSKVPLLGDIPLVGGLFRRTEKTGEKSELVILLSPVVLIGDRIEKTAAEALERVEDLKEGISAWPLVPGRSKR